MSDDNSAIRDDLVHDLELRSQWRRQLCSVHPDDPRQVCSADALALAATDVAALPADDKRLDALASFYESAGDDAISRYLAEQNRVMSMHGFDAEAATTDDLLAALVSAAETAEVAEG